MDTEASNAQGLMTIESIQKILNRSRASVYRYANTEPDELNPPYKSDRLNPEPLLFHPNEVARFAQDALGMKQVTIAVQQPPETVTQDLLREILAELRKVREVLEKDQA
jgi:hypothetical protein